MHKKIHIIVIASAVICFTITVVCKRAISIAPTEVAAETPTMPEKLESHIDIDALYAQVQDKFNDTIARFNLQYETQYAIATPSDLDFSGSNAQQIYQDMLSMNQEAYWETPVKAYDADIRSHLPDDIN